MATGESKGKWNGQGSLPEQPTQPSGIALYYAGKRNEQEILATEPANVDMVWTGVSPDSHHNRLYYGDNFPILAHLASNAGIRGNVRLIYIDPPYSTRSVFKSRSQKDAYQDLLAGAEYLEFMRQRLVFLRELLATDGSIYVHIDDTMAFHLKIILDEVFGYKNFRNCITRRKCNPKNYTRKVYGNISDYIFFYTKSDEYVWNRPYEKWTDERAQKEYTYIESSTGRRFKKVPIHAPGTRNGETGKPWRGMKPPPGKHWQYPPHILDEMNARGEIFWSSNGNPRRKIYLENSQGVPVQDIWWDVRNAHNQNIKITGYPTEKNPDLLTRIIGASSNPGDLVLDCFAGSGTTLVTASRLDRRWIGIDNGPEAISATLKRFASGVQPMGDFVNKPRPVQLPLGLSTDTPEVQIGDFALYAIQDHSCEIRESIELWRSYH